MANKKVKLQSNVYHEQQAALTQRLSKLGFFVGLETGFIDYQASNDLTLLSEGTYVTLIPRVKAVYFSPDPGDDDGLYSSLIGLLYDIAHENIGTYSCSKIGFTWVVFDTEAYAKLCETTDFEFREFRVFPQQDS